MMRTDDQTGHKTNNAPYGDLVDEERARKRAEIGLSPSRPTARADLHRPPAEAPSPSNSMRWLAWLLGGVILVTFMLVLAKVAGAPTSWSSVRAQSSAWLRGDASGVFITDDASLTAPYRQFTALDFDAGAAGMAEEELSNHHQLYADHTQDAYHMRVWPGNLAWSVLGNACPGPYRVETSALVFSTSPDGYAGLLARFQNAQNFYLFVVNGEGEYRVTLLVDGQWRTLQPWTASQVINRAGVENVLALADDDQMLSFYVNDSLLHTIDTLGPPVGDTGLAGGAVTEVADITFDWLRFYNFPCQQK